MSDTTDSIIEQFAKAAFCARENAQEQLAKEADKHLELIRMARAEGAADTKASNASMLYSMLMDSFDASETAEKWQSVSREEVDCIVGIFLSHRPPEEDLLTVARSIKAAMLAMSEEDQIAFTEAVESVLPPGLQAAERAARNGRSIAEDVREIRALAASVPDQALADALAQKQSALDQKTITDSLYNFLQQATPGKLETLRASLHDGLEGENLALLIKRGWDMAEEILAAAANGNYLQPAHPAKVKAFGRTLHEVLSVVEDALAAADMTVPPFVREVLLDQLDSGKLLRAAHEIMTTNAAQYGVSSDVTVGKPLRFKANPLKP
jgi:hypothetical protein